MPKILVLDGLSEEGIAAFRDAGFEVDVKPPHKEDELAAVIGDYDGLVVRSATKVSAKALAKPGKLKVVGRAGAGTDNIDRDAATEKGVIVMNTPGGNTISTCEHTFALMLALCRNIPAAHASMAAGRWDRKLFMGSELSGKTLGIVGVGRIGGALAKRAQAFEMKVIAYDPILTKLKADALGVELVEVDELIERADFISVHVPKTEKTSNMLAMPQFKRMKPSCRIINAARGGIVNETELAQALKEKIIAGAALDVYSTEPFENNPFLGLDNIIMTPHLAASTDEAQLTVAVEIAHQMIDFFNTGAIINAVNVPSLDSETRAKLQPLLFLASRLGRFHSLYMQGTPQSIEVEYSGELGITDTYPVTAAIIEGFLAPQVETVNLVNAGAVLRDHGITMKETRSATDSDYAFRIRVTNCTDKECNEISGTLFGDDDPRICDINGTRMDAVPTGWMAVCINEDKPLVLGRICTIIGESGVNIANLTLGRDTAGGHATTIINLDSPLSAETLQKLASVEHVNTVRQVQL